MRIAQIMLAKRFGGAERSFVDMCVALSARGHEVLAICERRAQALNYLEQIPKVDCRSIRVFGVWDFLASRSIKRMLRDFQPQIIHTHLARAATLAGPVARALGIPSLAKTHNYVDLKYYRAIDHMVPTTSKQKQHLRGNGIAEKYLSQIPNFSLIAAAPIRRESRAGAFKIVSVGRLVHKKGFDVLLRAVAKALRNGLDVKLEIAGDGPEAENLKRLADDLRLRKVVTFLGWLDSVENCLAGADAFVLPSRDEPFGIVCLEAMALEIPIIATRTDGPNEILDGNAAILIERENVEALKDALCLVASDPHAAACRAAVAQDYFTQRYSEQAVVAQYLGLYERLILGKL